MTRYIMAAFLWYIVKSDLSIVLMYSSVHWTPLYKEALIILVKIRNVSLSTRRSVHYIFSAAAALFIYRPFRDFAKYENSYSSKFVFHKTTKYVHWTFAKCKISRMRIFAEKYLSYGIPTWNICRGTYFAKYYCGGGGGKWLPGKLRVWGEVS